MALFSSDAWQMTYGERSALEGVLADLEPALAIEIGTAEGGSLRRISARSAEVHSFDLVTPDPEIQSLENVVLHTGDSHVLLAEFLGELESAGRNVDFALVDGDHTAEGVKTDMEALLASPAVRRCVILIHDTVNEVVRDGLERVSYDAYPRVAFVDLDFVGGHLSNQGDYENQLWGGLGLVIVDDTGTQHEGPRPDFYSGYEVFSAARDALVAAGSHSPRDTLVTSAARGRAAQGELSQAHVELSRAHATLDSILRSPSWRLTAPLRRLKASLKARLR